MADERNRVVCPTCGEVRLETPAGTRALPTFGTSLKAAQGAAGTCECGRRRLDEQGDPVGPRPGEAPGDPPPRGDE